MRKTPSVQRQIWGFHSTAWDGCAMTWTDRSRINSPSCRGGCGHCADLNERCGIRGAYQNHAGAWVGAAVWDLWLLLKELDTPWLGVQYDVRHAMVESAHAWVQGMRLTARMINSLVIKDYAWHTVDGRWKAYSVPLRTGAVDFASFLEMVEECRPGRSREHPLRVPPGGG